MKLNELTLVEAAEGLRSKKYTALKLTQACLNRIKERNDQINAFITICETEALEAARRADEMLDRGEGGVLTGIPFAVKDAICTAGVRSTGAAKILDNYTPPFDATVIKKIREQGGVLLGKNNCDTFGHGASNENSMYGPVKNPHDLTKVAGGSSGGSAAAVADNMCIYSIAEDTGGSIRFPASLCGVVGLRPSYGRNSRYGIMPMASSLDVVGPITKTVEDAAIIMEVIAGVDGRDATTVPDLVPKYTQEMLVDFKKLRVGLPKEYLEVDGFDPEVKEILSKKVAWFKEQGATIVDVSLPYTKYAISVYYILVPSEDSSNLARLEGIRYGSRVSESTLYETYAISRVEGFPEEVKRRILIGTYALSAGYYDAYYKKAQAVRTLIIQDFNTVFKEVNVLITPTSPYPAFGLGEKATDPLALYLTDIMVSPAALAGVPAISVPAGSAANGLPIGVQLIAPRLQEARLLAVATALEKSI